eukprot:4372306-Prymnesium_polylepis.1
MKRRRRGVTGAETSRDPTTKTQSATRRGAPPLGIYGSWANAVRWYNLFAGTISARALCDAVSRPHES